MQAKQLEFTETSFEPALRKCIEYRFDKVFDTFLTLAVYFYREVPLEVVLKDAHEDLTTGLKELNEVINLSEYGRKVYGKMLTIAVGYGVSNYNMDYLFRLRHFFHLKAMARVEFGEIEHIYPIGRYTVARVRHTGPESEMTLFYGLSSPTLRAFSSFEEALHYEIAGDHYLLLEALYGLSLRHWRQQEEDMEWDSDLDI